MNNVKKYKFVSSVAIAIAVVLVIVVNVFVSVLNNKLPLKIDLTSNKMYELSDKTKEYLKNYDTPVDIYILAGESEQDGNIRTVLDKYAAANENINVTNINMTSNPTFGKKYVTDGKSLQSNSVIVDGGDKFKTYTMTELYGVNAQTGQYTSLNVENKITSALKYVSSETQQKAYLIKGHNEIAVDGAKTKLESENFEVGEVNTLTDDIPSDANMLIVAKPTADFSKEEILDLLEKARRFEENPNRKILEGKVVATLFFEPSTRTRLSFETAVNRLGGKVIGFSDASTTSSSKGETLKDTIMMVSNYVDLIIMRHHLEGAARYASEISSVPVINAGDGANQHPSQTMLDLYSIYKTQGTLSNLNITMVGDLKYGRTVHSLLMAMSHFNPTFHFVAPDELKMPIEYKLFCEQNHIPYFEHTEFSEEVINQADILYMTRVQRERFTDLMEYEKVKNVYTLHNSMLEHSKDNLRILHPLPRVNEISYDVDSNPKAYYFQQAKNGLFARQAIICKVLGIEV